MAHFAKVFERKAKLDIRGDKRAMQRLRRACENVNLTLTLTLTLTSNPNPNL